MGSNGSHLSPCFCLSQPTWGPISPGPSVRTGASFGFDSKLSTQYMAYHSGPADPVQLSLPLSFAHEHYAADLQGLCTGHPPPPDFRVIEFPSLSLWGHCETVLTPKLDCNLLVLQQHHARSLAQPACWHLTMGHGWGPSPSQVPVPLPCLVWRPLLLIVKPTVPSWGLDFVIILSQPRPAAVEMEMNSRIHSLLGYGWTICFKLSQAVVSRLLSCRSQVSVGCWLEVYCNSLPRRPLHRAVHNMASGFP